MKKIFYLAALGAILFTSCAKTDNPNEEKTYSFEIGAEKETDGTDETRVEYVDDLMHWSVGDQIGMYVTSQNATSDPNSLYINNFAMTGRHTEPTRTTTFAGKLTQSQIAKLNPNILYRHFSFYPYISRMKLYVISQNGVILHYNLPSTITARPYEFPTDMVYMLADGGVASPMTWLENGEQRWSETRTFTYKHTMAYLRLRLNQNLTGRTISNIRITTYRPNGSGSAVPLSGNVAMYSSYLYEGERVITYDRAQDNGTALNYINVNIEGGVLNVGDYIYIPIPPNHNSPIMDMRPGNATQLQFAFGYMLGNTRVTVSNKFLKRSYEERLVFEAGKIYDISFNL